MFYQMLMDALLVCFKDWGRGSKNVCVGEYTKSKRRSSHTKACGMLVYPFPGSVFSLPFAYFILVSWMLGGLISPHNCDSSDQTWKEKTILAGEDFQHPQVWSSENTGGAQYINRKSRSAYFQDYQNSATPQQERSNEFIEWMLHMPCFLEM